MQEFEPIHTTVWEKLDKLAEENYQLKRANTKLRKQLKYERRKNEKLRAEKPKKQHYRNKRKHGNANHR